LLREGKIVDREITTDETGEIKKICITVMNMPDNAEELISRMENINNVAIEGSTITFSFKGDDLQQHELLRTLIENGFSINEFYVKRDGVQEQYMETVSTA